VLTINPNDFDTSELQDQYPDTGKVTCVHVSEVLKSYIMIGTSNSFVMIYEMEGQVHGGGNSPSKKKNHQKIY
jgi:hypothetical protein